MTLCIRESRWIKLFPIHRHFKPIPLNQKADQTHARLHLHAKGHACSRSHGADRGELFACEHLDGQRLVMFDNQLGDYFLTTSDHHCLGPPPVGHVARAEQDAPAFEQRLRLFRCLFRR